MKNTSKVTVYGVFSTRDGEVRYIGQTRHSVARRLGQHLMMSSQRDTEFFRWMASEIEAGYGLGAQILVENAAWCRDERATIEQHRADGGNLFNVTDKRVAELRSSASKAAWSDPDYRKRVIETRKRIAADPDRKAALSARLEKARRDPLIREKMRAARAEAASRPEYKAKVSEQMRKRWLDPEFRARMAEHVAKRPPEWKEAISKTLTGRKLDEEHRRKIAEGAKRYWQKRKASDDADS